MRPPDETSWDVMILNFDGHTPLPLASFRPGRGARPMGPPDRVRRAIDTALADVDWFDPKRGVLDAGEPVLELDLGDQGVVQGFVIHVRRPRGAAALIAHLCLVNGWAALDCASGAYLDLDDPDAWRSGGRPGLA
jgi:hypothetical protein